MKREWKMRADYFLSERCWSSIKKTENARRRKERERRKERKTFVASVKVVLQFTSSVSYFFGLRSLNKFSKNDSAALQGSLGDSVISLIG